MTRWTAAAITRYFRCRTILPRERIPPRVTSASGVEISDRFRSGPIKNSGIRICSRLNTAPAIPVLPPVIKCGIAAVLYRIGAYLRRCRADWRDCISDRIQYKGFGRRFLYRNLTKKEQAPCGLLLLEHPKGMNSNTYVAKCALAIE